MRRRRVKLLRRLVREDLARGSSVNIGFILTSLVLQLVSGLALAAFLGPAGVGAFAIGMLVLDTVMAVVHLPGVAFVREYSTEEREQALATVAAFKLVLCVPASCAILLLSGFLASVFSVPAAMIAILALYPPLAALASIATMVFEARRTMTRRNIPGLAENAGRVAAVLALTSGAALMGTRPEAAAVAWVAAAVPAAVVSVALAGMPRLRLAHFGKAREYFAFGWRTTIAHLLQKQLLWVGTAAIYLAYLGTSLDQAQAESGLFKLAYSLMFYMVLIGAAVPGMLYPLLSRAFSITDPEERRREAHRLMSLAFYYELILALPLALLLVVLGPWAFAFALPAFVPSGPLAQLLAVSGVLFCLTLPAAVALPAANRPDLTLRLFLVSAATAGALNIALVPQIGAPWGGAVGAVIADWATAAVGLVYALYLTRHIGIPMPSYAVFRAALKAKARPPPA